MICNPRTQLQHGGTVIGVVVILSGILILAGAVLSLSSTKSNLNSRSVEYETTLAAARAATEKVTGQLNRDFQLLGESGIYQQLAAYRSLVPTTQELLSLLNLSTLLNSSSSLSKYEFSDALGSLNKTFVDRVSTWGYTNLNCRSRDLRGYAATYRIISNARDLTSANSIVTALQQEVQVASIPVFQYQVFYIPELEVNPLNNMLFDGLVHGNQSIYCAPGAIATFEKDVTSAKSILLSKHAGDPVSRSAGNAVFQSECLANVNSLNFPIGASNTPAQLRALIDVPPLLESRTSPLGQQRLYNKADLIITVTNILLLGDRIIATSGAYNNFLTSVTWLESRDVIALDNSMYDHRECKTVRLTELNIKNFLKEYGALAALLGHKPKTIFIIDRRPQNAAATRAVRVVEGDELPDEGLTIVTPNPLYVLGHYNVPPSKRGNFDTSGSKPAALFADAITILSPTWKDDQSALGLSSRLAIDCTVNAALAPGIVPTGGGYYSGGLENAVRLLEDWEGDTLTINGAIAVLYHSKTATAPWGASAQVYKPPLRAWRFDVNFGNPQKLPPSTPELRTIFRSPPVAVAAKKSA